MSDLEFCFIFIVMLYLCCKLSCCSVILLYVPDFDLFTLLCRDFIAHFLNVDLCSFILLFSLRTSYFVHPCVVQVFCLIYLFLFCFGCAVILLQVFLLQASYSIVILLQAFLLYCELVVLFVCHFHCNLSCCIDILLCTFVCHFSIAISLVVLCLGFLSHNSGPFP